MVTVTVAAILVVATFLSFELVWVLILCDVKADTYRDQGDEHVQTSPDFDHFYVCIIFKL
jgi:hypothetical protein